MNDPPDRCTMKILRPWPVISLILVELRTIAVMKIWYTPSK